MFEDPRDGNEIVEAGRYVVKLHKLEPTEHDEYGPGLRWVFRLADPKRGLITDEQGNPIELWQTTSRKLSPRAKARPWVEALLGRALTSEDRGPEIAEAILGRRAFALIGPNERGYSSILQMTPYREEAVRAAQRPTAEAPDADPFAL